MCVFCLCLWAVLPELNEMMMMMKLKRDRIWPREGKSGLCFDREVTLAAHPTIYCLCPLFLHMWLSLQTSWVQERIGIKTDLCRLIVRRSSAYQWPRWIPARRIRASLEIASNDRSSLSDYLCLLHCKCRLDKCWIRRIVYSNVKRLAYLFHSVISGIQSFDTGTYIFWTPPKSLAFHFRR